MRAAAMSANVLSLARGADVREKPYPSEDVREEYKPSTWSRERYAIEQARALVRQVFGTEATPCARQVVIVPIDATVHISEICIRVGECLAAEQRGNVAVVESLARGLNRTRKFGPESTVDAERCRAGGLRDIARRLKNNVWVLANEGFGKPEAVQAYLEEVRKEFDYSIVEGPPGDESEDAIAAAQCADGMILAVAQSTRRVLARTVREKLRSPLVRMLGVVLTDRGFPIPDGIYRRL
jgi:hypothetical protein